MKKIFFLLNILFLTFGTYAQLSKTIDLATAGTLSSALTASELQNVTKLTITGTIDARDFKTMRDSMPVLAILDLSEVSITAYNGTEGTSLTGAQNYPANCISEYAFFHVAMAKPSLKSIVLPSSATSIGDNAFDGCSGLTSVTIPSSVTSIGDNAFAGCSGLTSVTIPSSVTSIGYRVFVGCSGLTTVTIPSSVTSIEFDAFGGCLGLISITIPSSITSIGDNAFFSCSGLTSVTIPSSVTSIGNFAFSGCSGLTSVTIPSSVTSIGTEAFGGSEFIIDTNNPNYSSLEGVLYNKTQTTIIQCPTSKIGRYTIPSSVTSIGDGAFSDCSGLASVSIPSSVTSIGIDAFFGCSGLTTVTIPSSVTSIGSSAFFDCSGLTSVSIPSSVTSIGNYVFADCYGLTTVTIPSSVTSIENYAFGGCSGLTSVTIPSSLTSIGSSAFLCCSGLTSVSIPSSVTSIGDYTFSRCIGLTTVTIPSSVTSIGDLAFADCYGLTSITSMRTEPINLSYSQRVFSGIYKTTCILYVPIGSKRAYQAADQWKDFTNIVEKDLTGSDPIISDQKWSIYPNPTSGKVKLVFDKITPNASYLEVYDVAGQLILKRNIQIQEEWIDLKGNAPGLYLIKTNLKNFKVQKVILK